MGSKIARLQKPIFPPQAFPELLWGEWVHLTVTVLGRAEHTVGWR